MSRIQLDTRNGFAPTFVPYLLRDLHALGRTSPAVSGCCRAGTTRSRPDSAAAAYYNAVWRNTLALTFHDELPESVWPDGGGRWFEVMRRLLAEPNSPWWDDVDTDGVIETRDDILARGDGRRPATSWSGGRPAARSTGPGGTSTGWTCENQTARAVRHRRWSAGCSTAAATRSAAAARSSTRPRGTPPPTSYDVTAAPSMRMVVSLADLDASRWVNLTGASGHAFDPHYVDQTDLWVDGRDAAVGVQPRTAVEAADRRDR